MQEYVAHVVEADGTVSPLTERSLQSAKAIGHLVVLTDTQLKQIAGGAGNAAIDF